MVARPTASGPPRRVRPLWQETMAITFANTSAFTSPVITSDMWIAWNVSER